MSPIFVGALTPAVVAIAALVVLAVAAGLWVMSRRRALPGAPPPPALSAAPPATAPRQTVDAPIEVTPAMSLRDIKTARAARIEREFMESGASVAEKERRKGKIVPAGHPPLDEPRQEEAGGDALGPRGAESGDLAAFDEEAWEDAVAPAGLRAQGAAAPGEVAVAGGGLAAPEQLDAEPAAPEQLDAAPAAAGTHHAVPDTPATDTRPAVAGESPAAGLGASLEKTRGGFVARLGRLFSSKATLDDTVIEQMEEVLFTADIGVKTGQRLVGAVQDRFARGEVSEPDHVWGLLRGEAAAILHRSAKRLELRAAPPTVLLMVGVNGAGKTTTIGKLAAQFRARGLRVLVVAGDTFRAAAVDQLAEWTNRVGVEIYAGKEGGDPSGVVFDGLKRASERLYDVVLVDTAGRLQTKAPLMDELRKIARVAAKAIDGAPHETILVIDANTGQNAIQQAKMFGEAVPLTGLVLTKLDGTAKGGVILGISDELGLPIYHIGIGEAVADLRPFDPDEFVDALF